MDTKVAIDLKPFCCHDGFTDRFAMHEPFIKDGYVCATDGRIGVMISATGEPDSVTRDKRFPPLPETMLRDLKRAKKWEQWPEHVTVQDAYIACPDCDRLPKADVAKCKSCNGRGERMAPWSCRVGGKKIQIKYERLIRAIPKVEFASVINGLAFRSVDLNLVGIVMKLQDQEQP